MRWAPTAGTKAQTIAQAVRRRRQRPWAAFDPATVITRHGQYHSLSGLFEVAARNPVDGVQDASNPENQDRAAQTLSTLAAAHGIECSVLRIPGGHDWPFAARGFGVALPWLAARLGTAGVPAVPMPGRAPGDAVAISATPSSAEPQAVKPAGR